jgi:hypothetical protein
LLLLLFIPIKHRALPTILIKNRLHQAVQLNENYQNCRIPTTLFFTSPAPGEKIIKTLSSNRLCFFSRQAILLRPAVSCLIMTFWRHFDPPVWPPPSRLAGSN